MWAALNFFPHAPNYQKEKWEIQKKPIKYYCKHNSLQQIYIWFCLPYCPEVCWHGKALRPEEWAIKNILVPAGTETAGASGATAFHSETIGWFWPQISHTGAHGSSHSSSPAVSTESGALHKGHNSKFLLFAEIRDLNFFFYACCNYSSR